MWALVVACGTLLRADVPAADGHWQDVSTRLVEVECSVSQRSFVAPWDMWYTDTVKHVGLASPPFVLTFAQDLEGDVKCEVAKQGHGRVAADIVRTDRQLDLAVLRVDADWLQQDALPRAGVVHLGEPGSIVSLSHGTIRVKAASLESYKGYASPPMGLQRLAGSLSNSGSGFYFVDKGGKPSFAGLSLKGSLVPEWTLGAWDSEEVGLPMLGASLMAAENDAMASKLCLEQGLFVRGVAPTSALAGYVEAGSLLTALDGEKIARDGTVYAPSIGVRVPVPVRIALARDLDIEWLGPVKGGNGTDKCAREKGEAHVAFTRSTVGARKPVESPSFAVVGGLVFAPLTEDLIEELSSPPDWLLQVPTALYSIAGPHGPVVLANVLPHPVNEFFPTSTVRPLAMINGMPISDLASVAKAVSKGLKDEFLTFSFAALMPTDDAVGITPSDTEVAFPDIVMRSEEVKAAQADILGTYGLGAARSPELCSVGAWDFGDPSCARPENATAKKHTLLRSQRKAHLTARPKRARDHSFRMDEPKEVDLANDLTAYSSMRNQGQIEAEAIAVDDDSVKTIARKARKIWPDAKEAKDEPAKAGAKKEPVKKGDIPLRHVVKILTLSQGRSFLRPWALDGDMRSTGTGVLVRTDELGVPGKSRQIILTNAHVVNEGQVVYVQRQDLTRKLPAKVLTLCTDVDLGIIEVDDEDLWADVAPLETQDELPGNSQAMRVAGYPLGGNAVSVTTGIVSRVVAMPYEFSQPRGALNSPAAVFAVQVDAAINPGNSGGPVFDREGKLAGLAFAAMAHQDNMGFVIPMRVIKNVLPTLLEHADAVSEQDAEAQVLLKGRPDAPPMPESMAHRAQVASHKRHLAYQDGLPEVGVAWVPLENAAARTLAGLAEDQSGVHVRSVAPLGALYEKVQPGDILVAIDDHAIAGDGTIVVPGPTRSQDVRVPFDALISTKAKGSSTEVQVLRKKSKEVESLKVDFTPFPPRVPRYDKVPSYVTIAGLVWTRLTVPLLLEVASNGREVGAGISEQLQLLLDVWSREGDAELVVLIDMVPGKVNEHYAPPKMQPLRFFNGKRVTSLEDLVEHMPKALKQEYVEFDFGDGSFPSLVLDASLAAKDKELLDEHAVPAPVSDDLLALWCKSAKDVSSWAEHAC